MERRGVYGGERKSEYIATECGIFKNFFCRQQFQVAGAASPHPGVMYRWLFVLHTYTDYSPVWLPA